MSKAGLFLHTTINRDSGIMIVYAFFVRKHTSYGKKWYAFMKWFETRDDTLLDIIRE